MKVQQLMTKNVQSCVPTDTLNRAAQLMWDHDCGCVPVVDRNGILVGMLTDRDVCMAAYTNDRCLAALRVDDAMAKQVIACGPFDTVDQAEALMRQHQVRRLPVVGFEGRLLGILSLNDLARVSCLQPASRERGVNADAVEATLAAVGEPRTKSPHSAS